LEPTQRSITSATAVGTLSIVLLLIGGCGGLALVLIVVIAFLILKPKKRGNPQP
jgi:hypothetical protein